MMSRVQLALNVVDLEKSVEFYATLFGVQPHKRRDGYANFQVQDPPLKLVLFETPAAQRGIGTRDALNHVGVEVTDTADVRHASERLAAAGLATLDEEATVCCHAEQDKVWVSDPAGLGWEVYAITDDSPAESASGAAGCCSATDEKSTAQVGTCCAEPAMLG